MLQEKKKIICALVLICALQLALSLFWGNQKNYLFFDEVFSYTSANSVGGAEYEFKENEWMDESWFSGFMSANPEHTFEYSIPYKNQIGDVHPPLFYMLLHTACSFTPGVFSYWSGIGVNILFFLGCTIVLYFLAKELFRSRTCGLIVGLLYAESYGGLNTMVFIRMYMLLTFMVLLHTLVYLKYFECEKIPTKGYVLLALTLIGGVLSQYYFLFIAFSFGVWYTIKFFLEKRYKEVLRYFITIIASAGCSLIIWPSMIGHLFGGGRGEEARTNLLSLDGYFNGLKEMFRIMNNDMFTKLLPVILIAIAGLLIICLKKGKKIDDLFGKKIIVVLFACIGYFLLATKAMPYQVDRYVMPIYPLIYLVVVGASYMLLLKLIPDKVAAALCVVGFAGLSTVHMVHSGIPYTYVKNPQNIERRAVVEEYSDNYALYISDNKGAHFYDAVQMLKEYRGYYYVYDLTSVEKTEEDMMILENEQNLVVYVKHKRTLEEANTFVQEVFPGQVLDENSLLDEDEKWDVYLLHLQ